MAEKTPDNFSYGNMTADFRMRYKKMIEERNKKKVKNKIKLIQAKIQGDMATKKDLKDLEKLKKLYPSMF